MKKQWIIGSAIVMFVFGQSKTIEAQSLKDILNSNAVKQVVNAAKELNVLKFEDLQGTWQYKSAACEFKSTDLLGKAGGMALAESVEKQLDDAYTKVGIEAGKFSYTFNSDSTFTSQMGKKKLKGTYAYDSSTGKITLKFYSLLTSEAQVIKKGDTIALLFDADRLLKLLTMLSSYSKNSTLSAINKLAEQYDGLLLGFDMNK